jgi:hypothetical protein
VLKQAAPSVTQGKKKKKVLKHKVEPCVVQKQKTAPSVMLKLKAETIYNSATKHHTIYSPKKSNTTWSAETKICTILVLTLQRGGI